jgi:hypothetical protein
MIIHDDFGELQLPEVFEPLYTSATPLRKALIQRFLRSKVRNTASKKEIADLEEELKESKQRLQVREADCKEIIELFKNYNDVDLNLLTMLDNL